MNGAGNDFMVVDARGLALDMETTAKALCPITGADGFMAVTEGDFGDFRLHYYNSDGSRGEMCGNGARCICRFAFEKGLAGPEMTVQTDAGPIFGRRLSETVYAIRMPKALDLRQDALEGVCYVQVGVPHAIRRIPGLSWADREALRPEAVALRWHKTFPKGANVDFYDWIGPAEVRILSYERGVEDYTLACGTGCTGLGAVLAAEGRLPGGVLTAHNPGGILTVRVEGEVLTLEGPAEITRILQV